MSMVQRGVDGRALWLPDSPASCSERGCPYDEDTAPYCQVMNIWTIQQESTTGSAPSQAAAVQVSVSSHLLDATIVQHISFGNILTIAHMTSTSRPGYRCMSALPNIGPGMVSVLMRMAFCGLWWWVVCSRLIHWVRWQASLVRKRVWQVLQRLPYSLFEAAARKLCKRSAALSIEECREYKVSCCHHIRA